MRFMCVQPVMPYYAWQIEVMLTNFLRTGVPSDSIDVVCCLNPKQTLSEEWRKLQKKFFTVKFYFYEKERTGFKYPPTNRPHTLYQHFRQNPNLSQEPIFYHDCDILFTRPPDFSSFLRDDVWYISDTESYIGAKYIKSKGDDIYQKMCDIIGIDPSVPEKNQKNSGGAQYIMKNVNATFWEKVEYDCEKLYSFFLEHLKIKPATAEYNPIQKWTADMWSVLWNAWYFKHEVRVVPELSFSWATSPIADLEKYSIYHNAGVVGSKKEDMFFKGDYTHSLPFDIKASDYTDKRCSKFYVDAVLDAGKDTCLR